MKMSEEKPAADGDSLSTNTASSPQKKHPQPQQRPILATFQKLMKKIRTGFRRFFIASGQDIQQGFVHLGKSIGGFCKDIVLSFIRGDWPTKLTYLIFGFGYWFRGQKVVLTKHGKPILYKNGLRKGTPVAYYQVQWLRASLLLAVQTGVILLFVLWGLPNLSKLDLQNLTPYTCVIDSATKKNVCGGDSTFLILLYSIVMIVILVAFTVIYFIQIKDERKSEIQWREGRHVNSALDDIHDLFDGKFYKTVLFVPILGVIVFTIVPILFMICIAFTNYDGDHLPPGKFFSWVGWTNFETMFSSSSNSGFNTVFVSVLTWTILWAILATVTCYLGGIVFALILNSKNTRWPKFWRTCFVVTIAVPQFVSLMLVRFFLSDNGVANALLNQWGVVSWAQSIGWISKAFFPFLSDPVWIKWTVVIVNMWIGFPYMMLITTGILMNIPSDLYESARIDGAGKGRMFWSITMPYILQVTGPYLIASFVANINNFNVIYLLTSGYSTSDVTFGTVGAKESDLLVTWLFNMCTGSGYKYDMASVIGIMAFVISAIVTLLAFTQTTKNHREERFQ